ncbi:Flp pilus assembly complex ATPase component TadA [bacterium]|nr:Flp pilus assembly complex ATPase component TadA [bacterium]
MILVTGTTGSGRSTTLAALIDYVNRTRQRWLNASRFGGTTTPWLPKSCCSFRSSPVSSAR